MSRRKDYLLRELVHNYQQGRLTRRQALHAVGGIAGALIANQFLAACGPAHGPTSTPGAVSIDRVGADDPSVVAAPVSFPGHGGERLLGYMAHPAAAGRSPVVLVCHAISGLTPHIEDVTRRLAKVGYLAIAVDLVAREGGSQRHTQEEIAAILGRSPDRQAIDDFASALAFARTQPAADPVAAGVIGFCLGGGIAWDVATSVPGLAAAVPFYGSPAPAAEIPRIQAAVLAIYGANDEIIAPKAVIPPTEAAMQAAGKTFRSIVYPNVDHAFFDDTGDSFDATASRAAWTETLAWLDRYLRRRV